MAACIVCRHSQRAEVDQAIAIGRPLREIAGQFGPSKSALDRHRDHVATAIANIQDTRSQLSADAILKRLARLETHAEQVLLEAQRNNDPRLVLNAVKELREQVEAIGRLARDVAVARGSAGESSDSTLEEAEEYLRRRGLKVVKWDYSDGEDGSPTAEEINKYLQRRGLKSVQSNPFEEGR